MTKKQKQKVRKVIGTGEFRANNCYWMRHISKDTAGLADRTKIEIVAVTYAEPERRVVPPEGAVWIPLPSRIATKSWMGLYNNGRIIAIADGAGDYLAQDNWVLAKLQTIELAQQAAEEAKADAEEDGFRWDEVLVAGCEDCGRSYGYEHGFPDLVLPNDVWAKISSTGDENGLLCPSCIVARCVKEGIECKATWRSGPFCQYEEKEPVSEADRVYVVETLKHNGTKYRDRWNKLAYAKTDFKREVASNKNKSVVLLQYDLEEGVELDRYEAGDK